MKSLSIVLALSLLSVAAPSSTASDPRSGFVLVANQQSASASLIDLSTDTAKVIPVGNGPHEAVISPSGAIGIVTVYGIAGQPGNELAVIDIKTGTVTKKISLGQYTRPHGAMFMPGDESRMVVTSETTGFITIVNLIDGKVEHAIATEAQGSHMVALTGKGDRAFTSNITGGSVSELNLTSKAHVRVIPVSPRTEGIAVTPDGAFVWAGSSSANGTVKIIDTETGIITKTLSGFTFPYRLAISNDGKIAIIPDPQGNKIHVADVAKQEVIWSLEMGSPRGVNISPDGKSAFVTLATDEAMGIVDLETRKLTRQIKVEKSPDGVWYGPKPR
jgi:DNA-binding beta-propeller fold protein YncE